MLRSFSTFLRCVLAASAVGLVPVACQSGGVGDPCTPEDEYDTQFSGFNVTEENIESRSFQCQTRICLVNHFQGRVSCPLGHAPPVSCSKQSPCAVGDCVEALVKIPACDPHSADHGAKQCAGFGTCNQAGSYCECKDNKVCIDAFLGDTNAFCDAATNQCKINVCHVRDSCQVPGFENDARNVDSKGEAKDCCVPGGDVPIGVPVCGQCRGPKGGKSTRGAEDTVYCSCRCDAADGKPRDPNFNYCTCPSGFSCSLIRPDVGLESPELTGKYCVKDGTEFKGEEQCGNVKGFDLPGQCKGVPAQ